MIASTPDPERRRGGTGVVAAQRRSETPLDRGRIVRAALACVAEDGIEGLSMRRLARRLGVATMSLYRHVDGKEALLELVVEALAEQLAEPPVGGAWEDAVTATFTSLRRLLADHPGIGPFVTSRALFTPSVLQRLDAVLAALRRAGLDPPGAAAAFSALWSFTVGSVVTEESLASGERAPARILAERERVLAALTGAAGEAAPHVVEAVPHWLGTGGEEAFRAGLRQLLDGVRAQAAGAVTRPGGHRRP